MTYAITTNSEYNSKEIYFNAKPDEATRDALKGLKFRWHRSKGCWYGFASEEAIEEAINGANANVEVGGEFSAGYMGSIEWTGNNAGKFLYGSELTSALRKDAKKLGIKGVSFRSSTFSGGQSVGITFKFKSSEVVPFEEVEDKYKDKAMHRNWLTCEDGREIHNDYSYTDEWKKALEVTARNLYEYDKSRQECFISHDKGSYPFLTENARARLVLLSKMVESYNHHDNNSMVDYFDNNFYTTYNFEEVA